ncbi:MAG: response regulator transcription factor [Kiritimatiellae bacterium]|nr:response regulator transcription factor [Kiritimatiellia bacterium]
MKIKVLIADDHTIVRAGLTALLGTEKDIEVVGEAKNGAEAVSNAVALHPDIVIMDLMMPKMDGVEATKELLRKAPSAKTILLTTYGTSDGIAHALRAGARGAVLKNADNSELAKAIRIVAQGGDYISPDIRQQLAADPPVPDLTPRQSEILESMVRGLTDRDIAQQLRLSPESVSEHVGAIRQKIGAANRTEAVAIAMRKYLLKF